MPANSCLVTDLQFAMTCLNNVNGGVINFQAVAQQCGMPTAAAAGMKLWRMKKAHPLPLNGGATGNPSTTSASATSGKPSIKRKPAAPANEDDSEDVESPKKCKIDDVVKKEEQED
ncbi:hypothetical protein D0862_03771 [Hortaea werneckii]|uniref:Myb-like DNA-binding domain-containing protein n=1 Tax=Hortaea werneckii TaxID=91943 RepID=A0A3M7H837_HORWE|nr:hypothetical protein D0862_03771 [Hortaea werneckii]